MVDIRLIYGYIIYGYGRSNHLGKFHHDLTWRRKPRPMMVNGSKGNHPLKMAELFRSVKSSNLPRCNVGITINHPPSHHHRWLVIINHSQSWVVNDIVIPTVMKYPLVIKRANGIQWEILHKWSFLGYRSAIID